MKTWMKKILAALTPKKSEWSIKWDQGHAAGKNRSGVTSCPFQRTEERLAWTLGYVQAGRENDAIARRGYAYDIFGKT